ncbi:MAG TPA: gluconokinase, GntK/IdnK-type [Solirubrobacterales bacterium]|jgi:gluconokinase|nr:gluconokinase, GntK/IdnK-type [Solirubrobacterales bacterium]
MIIVLIGVAGSGKTTLGQMLAARLHLAFLDADELHTPEAVEQMTRGEPLTDAQRNAWFGRVVAAAEARDPQVLACSALRRAHRDRLRAVGDVRMFLLDVPASVLERRLQQRPGHFFPARLLQSQLETLERTLPEEGIVVVDAARPDAEVLDAIVANLERNRPGPRHEQW